MQDLELSSSGNDPSDFGTPPTPGGSAVRGCVSPSPRSSVGKDQCLGKVAVGARVGGEKERAHWANVLAEPRKVVTQWQTLY